VVDKKESRIDAQEWDRLIADLPDTHLFQSWEWGEIKKMNAWEPMPQVWRDENGEVHAAGLILKRSIPLAGLGLGLCLLYVPRGPLLGWKDKYWRVRILDELQSICKREHAIMIKIDPEVVIGRGIPGSENDKPDADGQALMEELKTRHWVLSNEQIQFSNTVWLDLSGTEEIWLGRMKQKFRYNLNLARRKGVRVRQANLGDLPLLYRIYLETSVRDDFVIRAEEYYMRVWQTFMDMGAADGLVAEVDGEIVSGLFLFHFGNKAWYLYGMSTNKQREKMPNHLLQWEAMRLAKSKGCTIYDLWGAPEHFDESDSMWNVFRFKEGMGGDVIRTLGAWDYAPSPWLYSLYTRILPRLLDVMRRKGKERARRDVSA
jgi:peptidoglycan pentaglycine glycine transferase (the first glycine)